MGTSENLKLTIDLPEESTDIPTWHQAYNQNMKIIDENVIPIPQPAIANKDQVIYVDSQGKYQLGNYITETKFNTTIGDINSILDVINGEVI